MVLMNIRRILVVASLILLGACAPRFALPGPPIEAPHLTNDAAVMADGTALPLRGWPVESDLKAVILALHGFNDYSNFMDEPAAYLGARGIKVYAYDQRGFGAAPLRGRWAGIEAMADDAKTVARLLRARHRDTPFYLLGASMGGSVLMAAATEGTPPEADGLILSGPAVWGRETMPFYQRWALWIGAHTVPWATVSGRGIKRHPSDNIEMLRALARDPLVIKGTRLDTIYGLVGLMDRALNAAAQLDGRVLLLVGANDDIIPPKPTALMLKRLPDVAAATRRVARYGKGYHMLLRDLQAETVLSDIAAWIENPAGPLPSDAEISPTDP